MNPRLTYAAMMATAKTVVSSLQAVGLLFPRGEGAFPLQERAPSRARTAIATKAPINRISRSKEKKAKNEIPPRKQVRMTAKAV